MSLDCYPLSAKKSINLVEQPLALDVAYNDNLLISVSDHCQLINIHDLTSVDYRDPIRSFQLGEGIVLEQIIYCRTGDYLACVGERNGSISIYVVFNWKHQNEDINIVNLNNDSLNISASDNPNQPNNIDSCQRTGNLALSNGDTISIYKYKEEDEPDWRDEYLSDADSNLSRADTLREFPIFRGRCDSIKRIKQRFEHIIDVRLSIWAMKISLLENYLSITAVDHVQVLKLELLTLDIQSDSLDGLSAFNMDSGDLSRMSYLVNYNGTPSDTTSTTTTSRSAISDSNSTTTNFSSFNTTTDDQPQQLNNSDISIITMNPRSLLESQVAESELLANDPNQSADDCITWNLNTKKLVKLPTLMHNTSSNLSSYHICHPLELLGPASESIACRVNASIYSPDFSQNQLEAVVMLCKQFDFDRDPVRSTNLQAVYLSSIEDKKRISKSASAMMDHDIVCDQASGCGKEITLLKSVDYELLASVNCFVSTHTNCFIYSLHGKKVVRAQTIAHPDLCLDMRPDLLNVYTLTPLGLQICSSGICDSTFRYDWSSSSDLNLSFIAIDRMRVLTTKKFVILVACSGVDGQCQVEFMEKPGLGFLSDRIVDTVNHCNSISIRSNLLTYLHANALLALITNNPEKSHSGKESIISNLKSITIMLCKQLLQKRQTNVITNNRIDKAIKHLLDISMCDLSELMHRHLESESKRLTNSRDYGSFETDGKICQAVSDFKLIKASKSKKIGYDIEELLSSDEDEEEDKPLDTDYELIKIYLKHAKYSNWLLTYLVTISQDELLIRRVIDYISEHNPRLLIKCAQRYPLTIEDINTTSLSISTATATSTLSNSLGTGCCDSSTFCVSLLVEKLKQLVEFDSTGINRATVLFTLAILYNALKEEQKCLSALGQIKPLNHLAITMCSNYELSHSIASVVYEHYPDVYTLFLNQLAKHDSQACKDFSSIPTNNNSASNTDEREARDRNHHGGGTLTSINKANIMSPMMSSTESRSSSSGEREKKLVSLIDEFISRI